MINKGSVASALEKAKTAALDEFKKGKAAQESADLPVDGKIRTTESTEKQKEDSEKLKKLVRKEKKPLKRDDSLEEDFMAEIGDSVYSVEDDNNGFELNEPADKAKDNSVTEATPLVDTVEKKALEEKQIQELKENVEISRKAWIEMEWKKRNAYKGVYNKLGFVFNRHNTKERIEQEDEDINYYRSWYEDSLSKYKDSLLQNAGGDNISNEELNKIILEFTTEKNLAIADARMEVKIENQEGKFSNFIKSHSKELVDSYRKMSWKKKWLISGAFLGAGALTAGGAGAAAGVVGVAMATRKIFIAAVTGTGIWAGLDSMTRNKRENLVEKNMQEIMKETEGLTGKERSDAISQHLDTLIGGVNSELKKVKFENARNVGAGIVGGVAMSYGLSYLINHIGSGGSSEIAAAVGSGYGEIDTAGGTEVGLESDVVSEEVIKDVANEEVAKDVVSEGAANELVTGAVLEVQDGSSLEGTLIRHFKDLGMNSADAGRQAHLVALDYAKEHGIEKGPYSLIHKGAKLVMSEDGKTILGISGDDKLGWLNSDGSYELEKDISRAGVSDAGGAIEEAGDNSAEAIKDSVSDSSANIPEAEVDNVSPISATENSEMLDNMEKDLNEALSPEDSLNEVGHETIAVTEEAFGDECKKTMQALSLRDRDNWNAMRNMTYEQLNGQNGMSSKVVGAVNEVSKRYAGVIGASEARFKPGETISKWVARVVNKELAGQ